MGFEYMGPPPDPYTQHNQPPGKGDDTQRFQEPSYREHVSGPLVMHPVEAPHYPPGYPHPPGYPQQQTVPYLAPQQPQAHPPQAYPGYPGYRPQPYPYNGYYGNGNAPAYYPPGYYGAPYVYSPPVARPKRDGYLFGIAIAALACSILVTLAGLVCVLLLLLVIFGPANSGQSDSQLFSGIASFSALSIAGLVGGGFSIYHSLRSLMQKPSLDLKLPWFWIFFVLYLGTIAIGGVLQATGQSVSSIPTTIFLIMLAGILPALTFFALGIRRLHFPRTAGWPTTWRRFTLAIVSGATSAIVLAAIGELILAVILRVGFNITNLSIDNPNMPLPHDLQSVAYLFILLSVIAPVVEESVKPLAAILLIGRMRSAAEAFILGLACGIGFDLIETTGYISMGYHDWLSVALQRSTAGLLHGFGAAMVTLGWYYFTHPKSSRIRIPLGFGCIGYAILQHATWNGSFLFQLLPAPIGPYLDQGQITLGSFVMPSFIIVYIVESLLMLTFFIFVTGKLRGRKEATQNKEAAPLSNTAQALRPNDALRSRE